MAIGIARNALAALELTGPSAIECLERAGAVPMKGVRFMLAQGESQGSLIDEVDDGTTHECDILIGADGIHSTAKSAALRAAAFASIESESESESDNPAASPRNTGTWLVMTLQPFSIEDAREYSWIRDGSFILHNLLSDGQLVQFVIASDDKEAESTDRWNRSVNAEEIKSVYKDWPPHLSKAVDELLCDQPELQGIYLWEHLPAHTYVSGPICVMGDAAHATTPWGHPPVPPVASGGPPGGRLAAGYCLRQAFILQFTARDSASLPGLSTGSATPVIRHLKGTLLKSEAYDTAF
ncbi:hypothetical protein F4815DRAFT_440837 [Daldinia loculata]|nr:hypothetical protein F4815DRAFT_440837 [Daldinia loculata]